MMFSRVIRRTVLCVGLTVAPVYAADAPSGKREGVEVDKPSTVRHLVPAERLEAAAAQQFAALKRDAA